MTLRRGMRVGRRTAPSVWRQGDPCGVRTAGRALVRIVVASHVETKEVGPITAVADRVLPFVVAFPVRG